MSCHVDLALYLIGLHLPWLEDDRLKAEDEDVIEELIQDLNEYDLGS